MPSTKAKDKLFNKSVDRSIKLQSIEMQVYESIHRQNKHTHTHIQSQQPIQAKQIQLANESGDTRRRSTPRAPPPGIDATPVRCERTGRLIDKRKREAIRNEIRNKRRKILESRDIESPHQLVSEPPQQEKEVCKYIKNKSIHNKIIQQVDARDCNEKEEDTNSSRCGIRQRLIKPPPQLVSEPPQQKAIPTHNSIKTPSIQTDSMQQDDSRDYISEKRKDTKSSRCGIQQRLIDVDDGMEKELQTSITHDIKSKQKNQDLPTTDTSTTLGTTITDTINKVSQLESDERNTEQVQKLRATILHQETVIKSLNTRLPKVPELQLSLKSRRHPKHNMKPSTFGGRWIPPSLCKHKAGQTRQTYVVHTNDHTKDRYARNKTKEQRHKQTSKTKQAKGKSQDIIQHPTYT